jgi:CheY-like chemotaxis protein
MVFQNKQKTRLLFIDDDEINNFILQELFADEQDLMLNFFSDSPAAYDYLRSLAEENPQELPDIIFMDIKMPILDGFEFLDKLQDEGFLNDMPVDIFLLSSTLDSRDVKRAASYSRIRELVTKPLTVDKFRMLIARHFKDGVTSDSRSGQRSGS